MLSVLLAIALAAAPVQVMRDGKLAAEIRPRTTPIAMTSAPQPRASFAAIGEGQLLGTIRFTKDWRDYRGQRVPAGTYRMVYRIQPLLKDHAGTSRYRDFAALEQDGRTGHPFVMAIVPPDESELVIDAGGVRIGLLFEGQGESGL